VPTVNQGSAP